MALIECPECGKIISDKSEKCIGCGFPIKKSKNIIFGKININIKEIAIIIVLLSLIAIISIVLFNRGKNIVRSVNWKMTIDEVMANEDKMADTNEFVNYSDGTYVCKGSEWYGIQCSGLVYSFDDSDKLKSIHFSFEPNDALYKKTYYKMCDLYGNDLVLDHIGNTIVYRWNKKNMNVALIYSYNNKESSVKNNSLGILYENPNKSK